MRGEPWTRGSFIIFFIEGILPQIFPFYRVFQQAESIQPWFKSHLGIFVPKTISGLEIALKKQS